MEDDILKDIPVRYQAILGKTTELGFTMPSDLYIGSLLKTLISSKVKGNFLELGTGTGLSLAWMVDGMDTHSHITSVDNDKQLVAVAKAFFDNDERVNITCTDGSIWIKSYDGEKFDLVFADAWPGKYSEVDEILDLINMGGFYVIDDMLTQPNWPDGHQDKVYQLIDYLEQRRDLNITKLNWSTGIVIATKIK